MRKLQAETAELESEKKQLLQLCNELQVQIKESHKSLEESYEKIVSLEKQVATKDNELEDVRTRITVVAELFEKKEIT